ncbi:MAG: hypothetical protein FWG02_11265 [Holophagaceae bacterium]|nr:hypothetical protein [Holophagaceae bacterium]
MKRGLFLIIPFLFSGCVPPLVPMQNAYDLADIEPFIKSGNAQIRGNISHPEHGLMRDSSGQVVFLLPDIPFFRELFLKHVIGPKNIARTEMNAALSRPGVRIAIADKGFFSYNNLPDGQYLIFCDIGYWNRNKSQPDRMAYATVEVRDGEALLGNSAMPGFVNLKYRY